MERFKNFTIHNNVRLILIQRLGFLRIRILGAKIPYVFPIMTSWKCRIVIELVNQSQLHVEIFPNPEKQLLTYYTMNTHNV